MFGHLIQPAIIFEVENQKGFLRTDSDETWWTRWVCGKEELIQFGEDPSPDLDMRIIYFLSDSSPLRDGAKNDIQHDISKMYWAGYVLIDQALRGGDMRCTECPSSYSW